MQIHSISNTRFGGELWIHEPGSRVIQQLDTDKIIAIDAKTDRTSIVYDRPKKTGHNGYTYTEPTTFTINQDINTVLNAYNATKNSELKVDISVYKPLFRSDYE